MGDVIDHPTASLAPTAKKIPLNADVQLKTPDKPWQWQKGNKSKGGRPKVFKDVQELGQRWTPEIMRGVINTALMLREPGKYSDTRLGVALAAAKTALAYSAGLPPQSIELGGRDGG